MDGATHRRNLVLARALVVGPRAPVALLRQTLIATATGTTTGTVSTRLIIILYRFIPSLLIIAHRALYQIESKTSLQKLLRAPRGR